MEVFASQWTGELILITSHASLTGDLAKFDTLMGGEGDDTLQGGEGNDALYGRGGADLLTDNDATADNIDVLAFGADIAADQLWFRQVGASLEVSIIGTTDKSTITNWYSSSAYHVEQFKTADGKVLLDSKVNALVSAMAGFAPPAAGQTTLPAGYQTSLNPMMLCCQQVCKGRRASTEEANA